METPVLTILTINYNNAAGLAQTIKSVIEQSFNGFEFIIIDGGSTDGSVDVIKNFENNIGYWISEKDSGIYNAMNKGIAVAKGEYILFLNSGDYLADNEVLKNIVLHLTAADMLYGNLLIKEPSKTWQKKYPGELNFGYFIHDSLPHSGGIFIRREAFKGELAKYDESLKIVSDWKWFLIALFKYNYTYKYINKTIGVFDFSGISATNPEKLAKEKMIVFKKEFAAIYEEVSELLQYKTRYLTLSSSRVLKLYLRFKTLFNSVGR